MEIPFFDSRFEKGDNKSYKSHKGLSFGDLDFELK